MSKSNSIITRCGLENKSNILEYEITTANVEVFLRSKIQLINDGLIQKKADPHPIDPARIKVRCIQIGRNFAPLYIMLPDGAVPRQEYNPDLPSIYLNNDEDVRVPIKKWYYEYLARFMFRNKDIDAIHSRMVQRDLGIRRPEEVKQFVYHARPRLKTITNDHGVKVTNLYMMLNPAPLFHEMLIDKNNPNSRFITEITNFNVLEDNVARFDVRRTVDRKKKNKNQREIDAVSERMGNS